MAEARQSPKSYGFEDFEVRLEEGTLIRNGYVVALQDQPFRLLVLLVSRAGSVVTREEIQAHLWPANTNVEFDKSLRVAVSKLREALRDSASLPTYIETLPRRGYRFIRPVTVSEAPSRESVVPDLAISPTVSPTQPDLAPFSVIAPADHGTSFRPAAVSRIATWLAIAAIILTAFLYVNRKKLRSVDAPPVAAHPFARRSIAVIGLRNLSGSPKDRWLSTALAEMLATELSTSERLRVISGEEIAHAGLSEPPANTPSHESLVRYANQLGADIIVFGSYTLEHDGKDASSSQMRLDLRVENVTSEEPPITLVKTGRNTDLFSLVSASGSELRQHFGFGEMSLNAATAVRRTLPSDPEAAQLYVEGLNNLRNFDPLAARDLLLKASRIEPGHAGTHLALAEAWHAMGFGAEAKAEAARAVELGAGLPREELLTMQGELAVLSSDWPRAIDIYHSLLVLYPDDIEIGLRLVAAQSGANRYRDAGATLKGLHRPGLPRADEAKLNLSDASTQNALGEFRQAIVDADGAIGIAKDLENKLLRAQALGVKAFSLERLGDSQNSLAASTEAQNLYRAANDKRGLGVSLILSGDVLYDKGQIADARRNFLTAHDLFRGIGHRGNTGLALERVGNSYYEEGALAESRRYYQQALEVYREIHADANIGSAIGNIANVQDMEGDISGALQSNAQCVALAEKTGEKRETATALANMGVLEMERGNLDQASADFTRAAELDRQMNYTRGLSHALVGQGDVLLERNDISGALRQYDLAAKTIEGMDEPEVRIPSLIGQGSAHLLLGNADQAATALNQAAGTAVKNKEHGLATVSLMWQSKTLLAQGHLKEALDAANHAVAESQAQPGPQARLLATLGLGRVLLAQGKIAEAQELIRVAIAIAQRQGYKPLEMDLRILLAYTTYDLTERRSQLNAVVKAAAAHGWIRVASDASKTHL
jgi:DNA-binding winged helix-turn-helix (wHTH) protein/tetratricopeptide (TPR) repeat protein